MRTIHTFLSRFSLYRAFCNFLKKIQLPFFERVPLYNVIRFFLLELEDADITTRASAISFNIILAIFPAIIFLFTLIPFIPIENLNNEILLFFQNILPSEAYETIASTVEDIASTKRGGLLSLGFVLAIFFSSNGVVSMMNTFNKTNEFFGTRGYVYQRLLAIGLTFILTFLFLMVVIFLIGGEIMIDYLENKSDVKESLFIFVLSFSKWFATLVLIFLGVSVMFYFGPSTEDRWRFISPGAIMATLLLILTSLGFTYYVENFAQYNSLYGSIGTLVVIMLWVYFNSLMLIVGFEFNASIYVNKKMLSIKQ